MTSTAYSWSDVSRSHLRVWDIKPSFPMRVVQNRKSVNSPADSGFVVSRQTAVSVAGGHRKLHSRDNRDNWGRVGDSVEAETRTWTVNMAMASKKDVDRVLELYRGYPGEDIFHREVDEHNSYGGSVAIGFDPNGGHNYIPVKFVGPLKTTQTSASVWSFSVTLEEVR